MKRITWIIIVGLLLLTACQNKKVTYVGDDPNVALIVAKRGDMAYNDIAIIGMNVSERDHGTNLTILEHENNPDNYDKVFMDAVNAYNHVVMMSSNMKETLEKHADKYPEIKFLLYDGEIDWSKETSAMSTVLSTEPMKLRIYPATWQRLCLKPVLSVFSVVSTIRILTI